ncbi:MAG: hypothetical protein ABII02_01585 [Candidatus Magasanikbacteria bacterium]
MDKKRIIFAVIFALVSIGMGYLLYILFWAPTPEVEDVIPGEVTPGEEFPGIGDLEGLPTGAEGDIVFPEVDITPEIPGGAGVPGEETPTPVETLVENEIIGVGIGSTGNANFYNEDDGRFYRIGVNGQITQLSDETFFNIQNVNWSPTKNESIIEYPDGSNIYYNFDTKTQVTLPKHWEDFSFSPGGDQIAAKSMGLSPENRWLITSDPKGSEVSLIEPLGENANKVIVDWSPNKQIVAMSQTGAPLGDDRQELLMVGLNGENFKSTVVEGRGLVTQWSPSGSKLLHSVYNTRNDFKPELWIVNASGNTIGSGRKVLNVNTWADKCTFADDRFVYCAVPDELITGAGFNREIADTVRHHMYRIDTESGARIEVNLGDAFYSINNLYIDESGNKLYFTDTQRDGLYGVDI